MSGGPASPADRVRHLEELQEGRAIEKPSYDFSAHTRAPGTVRVEPKGVILVDGILLFEPSKRYADLIIPEGGFNKIGIEMIQARVALEISRRRPRGAEQPDRRAVPSQR